MPAQNNDVIVATIIHDNNVSGEQVNRFQFQLAAGGPVTDLDLLDDISTILESLYLIIQGMVTVRNVFREITVSNLTQALLVGVTDAGTYVGGTATGDNIPQGVSALINFKTNVPRVILKKYLPSNVETTMTPEGRVAAGGQTLMSSFAALLMTRFFLGPNEYDYGYFSPKTLSFELPSIATVQATFAYQRRRKEGRGS